MLPELLPLEPDPVEAPGVALEVFPWLNVGGTGTTTGVVEGEGVVEGSAVGVTVGSAVGVVVGSTTAGALVELDAAVRLLA